MSKMDESLIKPFEPTAIYFLDSDVTELVIRDCVIVWEFHSNDVVEVGVGYDVETGELVGVQLQGNWTERELNAKS